LCGKVWFARCHASHRGKLVRNQRLKPIAKGKRVPPSASGHQRSGSRFSSLWRALIVISTILFYQIQVGLFGNR
jgi:hypothetical protein